MRLVSFFFFSTLLAFNKGSSVEAANMIFLDSHFKDIPCKVYFFKSWATYQHPVLPVGALEYEDALELTGFYRAWMCDKNSKNYFVYFEGIENKVENTELRKTGMNGNAIKFYHYNEQDGSVGSEITGSETLKINKFFFSAPDSDDLNLVTQGKGISYEYVYDQSGALVKALITDFDGNLKTLNF